jgi:hypothetical protein
MCKTSLQSDGVKIASALAGSVQSPVQKSINTASPKRLSIFERRNLYGLSIARPLIQNSDVLDSVKYATKDR